MNVPVLAGVTVRVPIPGRDPLQAPLAVHVVTAVDDQLSVALCPRVMVAGATLIFTAGATGGRGGPLPEVLKEQLTNAACVAAAAKAAHLARCLSRDFRFIKVAISPNTVQSLRRRRNEGSPRVNQQDADHSPFTLPPRR